MCNAVHKYAEVIKAWADGQSIQFKFRLDPHWQDYPSWMYTEDHKAWLKSRELQLGDYTYEWRVKPVYLSLGEIARRAFQNANVDTAWAKAASAVKAAVESGEYA